MTVRSTDVSIQKRVGKATKGPSGVTYWVTYQGVLLGVWTHYDGGYFLFNLPDGKLVYHDATQATFFIDWPHHSIIDQLALVGSKNIRKVTVSMVKHNII